MSVTEFLHHVVHASGGFIADPHSEVLHSVGVRLNNLVHVEDLASGPFHLAHLVDEVPESGLRNNGRSSEQLHAVCRRVRVAVGGSLTADHLELTQAGLDKKEDE